LEFNSYENSSHAFKQHTALGLESIYGW